MSKRIPKVIEDSNHYHLWTDVLHARALSHQVDNKWDCAAYIRWTVIIGWIALEIACQDALEEKTISYSFRKNLDRAILDKNLPNLDWSKGIWQKVLQLQEIRKNYVHRFIVESNLFPDAAAADEAIKIIREAIKDIYLHTGKNVPDWVEDDYDKGWSNKTGFGGYIYSEPGHKDVESDPNHIKIAFIDKNGEHLSRILPSNADYKPYLKEIITSPEIPVSAIRIYRGNDLIEELPINMRGI